MTQGTDTEVIAFVDAAIASGNIDMMKGIAETVTDLSDTQLQDLLFSGSLVVVKAAIENLRTGSSIFGAIATRAITLEEAANNITAIVIDTDTGKIADVFKTLRDVCGVPTPEDQPVEVRFAKDNIARIILALNKDELDTAAVTLEDIIMELDKSVLSNQNAPAETVTPFLTSSSDILRAKAFIHKNTDNDAIIAAMTADDAAMINIDGFKLAMIADLNNDDMIQENASIVTYLLGENQSTPVRYSMFKNYITVVLNGGTVIPEIDVDTLIATYVK